ncbi:PEP-CTERM system TPR-repeat protein PrsT [Endozoicomonas sp. SM1973]|uniref:PEP-CTERM system TPR-repeat protein PrsT n=1 Tax=Spartinivicinus marinus TaxID=2994442 RepID=A0A853I2T2_9GAMM|nr:XrtA/PEP-CTERM system TPR-repeat protein PrsT [Spartinivicinus marinus]MCX4025001.1 PEP-CTERM system TPR-repeat protein PrsT [Spartinivicinus marinus]NYZ67693.1 PEP-CTERM system TPR-repeat protein PrsT [Spartinivicinus marinus]
MLNRTKQDKTNKRQSSYFKKSLLAICLGISLPLQPLFAADLYQEAEKYYKDGEYKTAIIQLKNLLKESPKDGKARALLGRVYVKDGNFSSAIKEWERASKLGALSSQDKLDLAELYLLQRKYAEAISLIELDTIENEQKPEALAIHGFAYLGQGMLADAKDAFNQAIAIKPDVSAQMGLARVAFAEADIMTAYGYVGKVLKEKPDHADALTLQAQLKLKEAKVEEAIAILNKVLAKNSKNFNALLKRAEGLVTLDKLAEAKVDVETVAKEVPNHPEANFVLTKILLKENKFKEAKEAAEKVLRIQPGFLPVIYLHAIANYGLENYKQAAESLEKYVSSVKGNEGANILLAQIYLKEDNPKAAIKVLSPLTGRDSQHQAKVFALLGNAYMKQNNYVKGTEYLDKALELEPDVSRLRAQAAVGHLFSGDVDTAVKELKTLSDKATTPNDADLLLVRTWVQQKKYDEASELVDQRIKKWPDNPVYYNLKGIIMQVKDKQEEAEKLFKTALEKDSKYVPSIMALAALAADKGEKAKAKEHYQNITKINNSYLPAYYALSALASSEQDSAGAIEWLKKANEINPGHTRTSSLLVEAYMRSQQPLKAEKTISEALSQNPNSLGLLDLAYQVYLNQDKKDKAQFYLEKLYGKQPENKNLLGQLVNLRMSNKNAVGAIKLVDTAILSNPEDMDLLLMKYQILMADKQYDKAMSVAELIIKKNPGKPALETFVASVEVAKGNKDKADQIYQKLFDELAAPEVFLPVYQYYLSNKDEKKVEELFAKATKKFDKNPSIKARYAGHLHQQGKVDEAIKVYEEVLSLQPEHIESLNNLAWFYMSSNKEKALGYAKKAYNLMPQQPEIADTYGWILLDNNQVDEALKLLQQALQGAPNNGDIVYHYAVALAKKGKTKQAKEQLQTLLSKNVNFSEKTEAEKFLSELN